MSNNNTPPLTAQNTRNKIVAMARLKSPDDYDLDNDGQLILYTGIFRHSDGTFHEEAEEVEEAEE